MIVFWAITPLQGGILNIQAVNTTEAAPMTTSTRFISAQQQVTGLTPEFAYSAFGISWLNETLPPYMSREVALAPFAPKKPFQNALPLETWKANTIMYGSDLHCWLAEQSFDGNEDGFVMYSNGKGCAVTSVQVPIFDPDNKFASIYAGYWATRAASASLQAECPVNASHNFLAIWSRTTQDKNEAFTPQNGTALFCEPTYFAQNVAATVSLPGKAITKISAIGARSPIPQDLFNITNFESIIADGNSLLTERSDIPTSAGPDQTFRLQPYSISLPPNSMIGYAIAADPRPPTDYLNPETLQNAIESAHRLLFARAMSAVLLEDYQNPSDSLGVRAYERGAVVVVRPFAVLVEALLSVLLVLTTILLYISTKRANQLKYDPTTIAASMSLVADSHNLLHHLAKEDAASAAELEKLLSGRSYALLNSLDHKLGLLLEATDSASQNSISRTSTIANEGSPRNPLELRKTVGSVFIVILVAVIVMLGTLRYESVKINGELRLCHILLNYKPSTDFYPLNEQRYPSLYGFSP